MTTMTHPAAAAPKLDPREEHVRIPSHHPGRSLFLRHLPPAGDAPHAGRIVLYVHGGTFPSALSIAHRFDGTSWRDTLCAAGFHVWGLDFHGFGALSDPPPEPVDAGALPGRAEDASRQLEQAVRFIRARHGAGRISLIAHSWGSIVAGHFAGRCPDLVERLVLFGPIARREPQGEPARLPAWRLISLRDQWDRFTADVPKGEPAVLSRRHFDAWGEAYLDVDPESRTRSPAAVRVPGGAFQDINDAWAGALAYDPALVRAPVAIIRGEWDSLCTDADAQWLLAAMASAPVRQDVKIARATHLMHLEEGRHALYRAAEAFLLGQDT
ncbi:MAG TPA: alpha/beta hydrolase [Acetobacteraceae bacterium]|nr:alpha/beta hydrolase [Acetobacteraceae bacterium]